MVSDEQLKKNKYRRKKVMLKRVHTKGMVALVMVVVILMALGGQVFRINYTHGETYAKAVLDHQTYTSTELPYKRGQILTGDGTVLAYSERVYNLILDVKLMLSDGEYKEPTLSALCKYFNLNRSELEQKVSENSQSRYQKLLSNLTTDQIADFKNLMADSTEGKNIKGVWFEDSYIRKYPLGTFASDGPVRGYYSATISTYKEYTTLEECNSASSYNTNCSYPWRKGDPMYWRIIRTNSDESVRLLYHGTSTTSTEAYIGTSKFNSGRDNIAYVSYMYGSLGSIANARTNQTNSSTIKTAIDNWYKDYLNTNYGKYLSTTAVYCNDRSTSDNTNFGAYTRLNTNKTPSYDCAATEDKFTVDTSTGNGKLTYPIALMTADEVRFAGGVYGINAPTWYYYNSSNGSSTGSTLWWLLSPSTWTANGIYASVFRMLDSSYPGRLTWNAVYSSDGVRPVISLKSCTLYSTGNGSASDPYSIKETTSGC